MSFNKKKFDNLADGKCNIEYAVEGFKMTATPMGIKLDGKFEINSQKELEEFAQMVSVAWQEHDKIRPKILTSLTGH